MRRWIAALMLALFFAGGVRGAELPEQVVAVGQAVGIEVECSGLLVVGFPEDSPARACGMRPGDLIEQVDGVPVSEPEALRALLQHKSQVAVTALRGTGEKCFLVPLRDSGGVMMLGANVKARMAGIGTVTYYDPATAVFGALGHGITDETGGLFPVRGGVLCPAEIIRADKGRAGTPGMLQGSFDGSVTLGVVTRNTSCGIFGTMFQAPEGQLLPVAPRAQVQTGPAEVLCSVSGSRVERFSAEIVRLLPGGGERELMLRITDPRLLDRTGGIVQGMSGSPILQNGALVGAVTHVLVADPEVGYGILMETILAAGSDA